MGLTKLGHYIANTCDENKCAIIIKATHFLGREQALKYLEFALRAQSSGGGFLTKHGTTVRTVGGMFLRLIKDDPSLDPAMIKKLFRVIKKRRRPKTVAASASSYYEHWSDLTDSEEMEVTYPNVSNTSVSNAGNGVDGPTTNRTMLATRTNNQSCDNPVSNDSMCSAVPNNPTDFVVNDATPPRADASIFADTPSHLMPFSLRKHFPISLPKEVGESGAGCEVNSSDTRPHPTNPFQHDTPDDLMPMFLLRKHK